MSDRASKKRRRGLWWKIPLWLVLILVVLVVLVILNLSTIVTKVANAKLPEVLGTAASVEKIELKPFSGLAAIHGLKIAQPEGFGEGQAVELGKILAKVDLGSLKSEEGILVEAIELHGLTAHVDKDAEGNLNLAQLGPKPVPAADAEEGEQGAAGDEAEGGAEDLPESAEWSAEVEVASEPFPGLRIARVDVSDIAVSYTDATTGDEPIDISLGNLTIQVADGAIDLAQGVAVRLGQGSVTLEDVKIAQPSGFGDDPLLHLPSAQLDIGSEPFVDNLVRLERLELSGLRAHIVRDTNSVMNVARLGGGPYPEPEVSTDAAEEEGKTEADAAAEAEAAVDEEAGEAEAGDPVGFVLGQLVLSDFGITYSDAALAEQLIAFSVADMDRTDSRFVDQGLTNEFLSVENLMVFGKQDGAEAAEIELNFSLNQEALLTLLARVGPVGAGVPDVNAEAKLSGFMLGSVGPLVPPGVRETVGANGLDLKLDLALTAETIDLTGTAITDKGHDYPVHVAGPLKKPTIELGIFSAVAGRLTGGALNLAGGTAGAALDVAEGVGGGAVDLAKGAGSTVGKVGGGLLGAVKAAATLDVGELKDEMKEATVGAVQEAGDAVQEAGGTVVDTAKDGMGSVKGDKKTMKWLEGVPARHAEDVAAARAALEAKDFPPPPLEAH